MAMRRASPHWPRAAHWLQRGNAGLLAAGLCLATALLYAAPSDGQTRPRPRPDTHAGGVQDTSSPPAAAAAAQPAPRPAPSPTTRPATRPATGPAAQDSQSAGAAASLAAPRKGPVTGQPLPRYVSLKGGEGNARRGPGLTHRIDWVFTTKGTPLRVTAEYENWRRVEDFEGFGGWVHFALLSGARYVLITQDMANFHRIPDLIAPVAFQAERGVLARLLECSVDWCRVNADGQRGWAPKSALWGVGMDEVVQ